MRLDVKLNGLDDILAKLDTIDGAHNDKDFERGMAEGGAVAVKEAKKNVPIETGNLRDSLHVGGYTKLTPGWRRIGRYGELNKPKGHGRELEVYLGSTLPYAHLVERGTSHSQAKPYLRRAIDENQRKILDAVDNKVQEMIDKA